MKENSTIVKQLEYQLQEMKNILRAKEIIVNNLLEELEYLQSVEQVDIY